MPNDAQRVADLQRRYGFDSVPGTELYRTPSPDIGQTGVAQFFGDDRAEELTEEQLVERTQRRIAATCDAHQAAADRAASAAPPVPAPVVRPDIITARAELRSATLEYAARHEAAARADEAVQRAQERVSLGDGQLSDYRDLDSRVTAWHANSIRRSSSDELPYDLQRQLEERGRIIDKVCALRKAHEQLKAEAAEAKTTMQRADTKRGAVAAQVVLAAIDELASELVELDAQSNSIRQRLNTACASWLNIPNTPSSALSLSTRARDAMLAERPLPKVDAVFRAALVDWHRRLMSDSSASLEEDDADAPSAAA